jgi:hypothetical protein
MNSPTLNKPLQIVSIDPKAMSLSDGSEMQFMPNFLPPRSWKVDNVVELEELKMKMYRITNRSQHQTQAQAMCVKGADVNDSVAITKSMDGEYPKTHLYTEWAIEELISPDAKILLEDGSLWSISAAFSASHRDRAEWSEGQAVEVSPISQGSSGVAPKIQAYNLKNKDISLMVTGKFLGFRQ